MHGLYANPMPFYIRGLSVIRVCICGSPGPNPPQRDSFVHFASFHPHKVVFKGSECFLYFSKGN